MDIELTFSSELRAPQGEVWAWITSVEGIARELRPFLRMTAPAGVRNLQDVTVVPGKPLFPSWILLFGVLPIDRGELTLLELRDGIGFVEQSPMHSMKLWRHERTLEPRGARTLLTDKLTFRPRVAAPVMKRFIEAIFRHRHGVLRRAFS